MDREERGIDLILLSTKKQISEYPKIQYTDLAVDE